MSIPSDKQLQDLRDSIQLLLKEENTNTRIHSLFLANAIKDIIRDHIKNWRF